MALSDLLEMKPTILSLSRQDETSGFTQMIASSAKNLFFCQQQKEDKEDAEEEEEEEEEEERESGLLHHKERKCNIMHCLPPYIACFAPDSIPAGESNTMKSNLEIEPFGSSSYGCDIQSLLKTERPFF